jgi:hypothetical protein
LGDSDVLGVFGCDKDPDLLPMSAKKVELIHLWDPEALTSRG